VAEGGGEHGKRVQEKGEKILSGNGKESIKTNTRRSRGGWGLSKLEEKKGSILRGIFFNVGGGGCTGEKKGETTEGGAYYLRFWKIFEKVV